MDELKSKVRNCIRRAQKAYDIERVDGKVIIDEGLEVYNSAAESYKVKASTITQNQLRERIESEVRLGGAEYWCVREKETRKIVAIAFNHVQQNSCNYRTLKATPESMHNNTYPYYGLIYEMNRYYLEERGLRYVNDGARSITEHSNVQSFLVEKFNFRKAYCRLQIKYKWWFGIAVRMLYPFRNYISITSVKAILKQEEMVREQIKLEG